MREPGLAGKIVVLDTQLKAINLLQSFADIHPMVVFLKITNPDSIRQLSLDALDDDALKTIVRVSEQTEQEWGHVFTHVVEIGDSFEETVSRLAEVVRDNVQASYWASSNEPCLAALCGLPITSQTSQAQDLPSIQVIISLGYERIKLCRIGRSFVVQQFGALIETR